MFLVPYINGTKKIFFLLWTLPSINVIVSSVPVSPSSPRTPKSRDSISPSKISCSGRRNKLPLSVVGVGGSPARIPPVPPLFKGASARESRTGTRLVSPAYPSCLPT